MLLFALARSALASRRAYAAVITWPLPLPQGCPQPKAPPRVRPPKLPPAPRLRISHRGALGLSPARHVAPPRHWHSHSQLGSQLNFGRKKKQRQSLLAMVFADIRSFVALAGVRSPSARASFSVSVFSGEVHPAAGACAHIVGACHTHRATARFSSPASHGRDWTARPTSTSPRVQSSTRCPRSCVFQSRLCGRLSRGRLELGLARLGS